MGRADKDGDAVGGLVPVSEGGVFRSRKLLDAVRELPCQLCGADDGTVVAAHSNYGKGMGIKSSDASVMALCWKCHHEHDQGGIPKEERREREESLNLATLRALIERGLLTAK
jgi:shikimate kinase